MALQPVRWFVDRPKGLILFWSFATTIWLVALPLPAIAMGADPSGLDPELCKAAEPAPQQAATECATAVAAASDPKLKASLLLRRAYAQNAVQHYDKALPDLTDATTLDPANWIVLHELGYTLNALGRYAEAEANLDREIELNPKGFDGYRERAYARAFLGEFQGAFDDRSQVVILNPADPDARLAHANAALWLGRFDLVAADLDWVSSRVAGSEPVLASMEKRRHALALWSEISAGPSPANNCALAEKTLDFKAKHLIGDCTQAFFQAKTPSEKARALWVRSQAWWVGQQDPRTAYLDTAITVALEPNNPYWRVNLGGADVEAHHSRAAILEFDKAIALRPDFAAYAGRASAKYNIGDDAGAFADAKKSFELQPNELALTVLGDLAYNRRHDPASAKLYWMGAYQLGDRDDGLMARLKQIGIADPAKDPDTGTRTH